jgi:hypothetical protein
MRGLSLRMTKKKSWSAIACPVTLAATRAAMRADPCMSVPASGRVSTNTCPLPFLATVTLRSAAYPVRSPCEVRATASAFVATGSVSSTVVPDRVGEDG